MNNGIIKVLVCCHKQVILPENEVFFPIQVGAEINKEHWGIQQDNEIFGNQCDNISEKNPNFCELTALYWAWKNINKLNPSIKYIGLCHYRRFFDFDSKLLKQIERGNIIIPKLWVTPYSVENAYKIAHPCNDIKLLKDILIKKYPEYKKDYEQIFEFGNKSTLYNMFVMPIKTFNDYCEWLFDILFSVEQNSDIKSYDSYQKRIYGFMAERLLFLFIKHNRLRYVQKKVIGPESVNSVKLFINNLRFNISFVFGKSWNAK